MSVACVLDVLIHRKIPPGSRSIARGRTKSKNEGERVRDTGQFGGYDKEAQAFHAIVFVQGVIGLGCMGTT